MNLSTTRARAIGAALIASAVAAPRAHAQASHTERAAVLDAIRSYDAAWARKDSAAVGRVLAADFRYFNSLGAVSSRAQMLGFLVSPDYVLEHAERTELEPRIVATTAVVSTRWRGHGRFGAKRFEDDQRCSLVLARQRATWRIVAEHCTQIRQEE